MQCDHFDAFRCRSCSLMGLPYAAQPADKERSARAVLTEVVAGSAWVSPFESREAAFRNKAKLAVGGTPGTVTLGILDADRRGVDLRDCGIHEHTLQSALPHLADWLDDLRLLPYDVERRRGELKHVHVTASPDQELMVRVVLRSEQQAERVRSGLPALTRVLPGLRVATINFLPEHVALLEGDDEEVLTTQTSLPMDLGRLALHLGPRSFFQTNTGVTVGLYEQARSWLEERSPAAVLDLYCGVGGFGLFAATLPTTRAVHGIEVSREAVVSARHTADVLRAEGAITGEVTFDASDATAALGESECVIVNPPRRGIGPELAGAIEAGPAGTVVYSSCNPQTLARDLATMPSFRVDRARLFDMFPQTGHAEILVLASR